MKKIKKLFTIITIIAVTSIIFGGGEAFQSRGKIALDGGGEA